MIANPVPWPDGARCAVAMTWDMDADSAFNWYNKETADNLVAATRNGGFPQRVRRGLGIRRAVDIGLASCVVGPPCQVQGGARTSRLYARQGRRLVRAARPGVRPCAEADGGGALDTALRDLPDLPKPAPRILEGTVSRAQGAPTRWLCSRCLICRRGRLA